MGHGLAIIVASYIISEWVLCVKLHERDVGISRRLPVHCALPWRTCKTWENVKTGKLKMNKKSSKIVEKKKKMCGSNILIINGIDL